MNTHIKLNLTQTLVPIGLLECKNTLSKMAAGEVLEVQAEDPEVIDNIKRIVRNSADQVIRSDRENGQLRIYIEKGSGSTGRG